MKNKVIAVLIIVFILPNNSLGNSYLASPSITNFGKLNKNTLMIIEALNQIKDIDRIIGIGTVSISPDQLVNLVNDSRVSILDEIADDLISYLSVVSHIDGNYSEEADKRFRETQIYQKVENTEGPISEQDFKALWAECLSQVQSADAERILLRFPHVLLPNEGSPEWEELKRWSSYFLANFRLITLRRSTGGILQPLMRYTSGMIRQVLIKDPEGSDRPQDVKDAQAASHLSRKPEFVELIEALSEGKHESEDIIGLFDHTLAIRDSIENPEISFQDSNHVFLTLLTLARKVSGNYNLSLTDLLRIGYEKRLTRNYLGYMRPDLPFKNKVLEKIWIATICLTQQQNIYARNITIDGPGEFDRSN